MNTRTMTLSIAGVLAVGTGLLTFNYLGSMNRASNAAGQPREVIVADRDIPARSTLTLEMFRRVMRPASAIEPDAIVDPSKISGTISLITLPAGSEITASKIGRASEASLPVRLHVGMRAISIPIDRVKSVSGLIQPGDHVDVIAVVAARSGEAPSAYAILRNVTVLSMGTTLESASATPAPDNANFSTATLEVTPKQADLLAVADVNTILRLALRSPKESARSEVAESLHFPVSEPQRTQFAPPATPAIAAAPATTAAPQHVPSVRIVRDPGPQIIDGDRVVAGASQSDDVARR